MNGKTAELAPGIHWVGIEDWKRRMFDALIPLHYGTSYNSYLVLGKTKKAIIDTVNPGFENEWLSKISSLARPEDIDYVVMNHAEPDHSGSIPAILNLAKNAKLVTTAKGRDMAQVQYQPGLDRIQVVKEGDQIDLGGKTLRFIDAPFLHWPETMFTLAVEDKVLFTCDFFGSHIASGQVYADEVGDIVLPEAKRYYAEIMMPFRGAVEKGLDKAKAAAPRIIGPSHGPLFRQPQVIMDAYEKWARGPLSRKAVIAYTSMWGSTDRMAKVITDAISVEGVDVQVFELAFSDISHVSRELVDASALVIGSPTVVGGPHPLVLYLMALAKIVRPRLKLAAFFGSYGWSGGAASAAKSFVESAGLELVGAVDVNGPPSPEAVTQVAALGKKIAQRIKETTPA